MWSGLRRKEIDCVRLSWLSVESSDTSVMHLQTNSTLEDMTTGVKFSPTQRNFFHWIWYWQLVVVTGSQRETGRWIGNSPPAMKFARISPEIAVRVGSVACG